MMHMRALTYAFAAALASLAVAQQEFTFRNKEGTLRITGYTQVKFTRVAKSADRVAFKLAAPNAITGVWTKQDLTLRAKQFEGVAARGEIESALLSGGVVATATRPSKVQGQTQTVVAKAETAQFNGATNRLALDGGVTIDDEDQGTDSIFRAKGAQGWLVLTDAQEKGAKGRIQSAALEGSVRLDLSSLRTVTEKGRRSQVRYTLVATGSRVDFKLLPSGENYGVVTLSGNVVITGNDPILFGQITGASKVVITLDSEKQPVDIESEGAPTTTTITQKRGRGRL